MRQSAAAYHRMNVLLSRLNEQHEYVALEAERIGLAAANGWRRLPV